MTQTIKIERVPESIVRSSSDVRKHYFISKTIAHLRLIHAKKETLSLVSQSAGPDIIIVTGPTGVGKTTLANKIEESVLEKNANLMEMDKSCLSVLRLDAVPPGHDVKFDWKDFYIRALKTFKEPCVFSKQLFPDYLHIEEPLTFIPALNTIPSLRRSFENTMKARKTTLLIIDEANHIFMRGSKNLHLQFEIIKSLSQHCNATFVLVGTYDLLHIVEQSAQLVRRSKVVHMSRYIDVKSDDRNAFAEALLTFQRHMPFAIEPNLISNFDYFFLKSAGCIGILKDWLDLAVERAIDENRPTIDMAYIETFSPTNKEIKTVLEEAFLGENTLKDIGIQELRVMVNKQNELMGFSRAKNQNDSISKQKVVKGKVAVGKRNPHRDSTNLQFEFPIEIEV